MPFAGAGAKPVDLELSKINCCDMFYHDHFINPGTPQIGRDGSVDLLLQVDDHPLVMSSSTATQPADEMLALRARVPVNNICESNIDEQRQAARRRHKQELWSRAGCGSASQHYSICRSARCCVAPCGKKAVGRRE